MHDRQTGEMYYCKSIFHPITLLLCGFGIDVRKRSGNLKRIVSSCAVLFYAVWIMVMINAVACFDKTDVFTIIKYTSATLSWLILYRKRGKIVRLMNSIARLQSCLKAPNNRTLQRCISFGSMLSMFIVFGPGIMCCVKPLIEDEYPMFFCSFLQSTMTEKSETPVLHFWLLSGSKYICRGLAFAVTIFYSFYCMELKRLANFLESKVKMRASPANSYETNQIFVKNNTVLQDRSKLDFICFLELIAELESTFSSLVFLQFLNSFLEILRIETVVLMYLKGRWQFDIIILSLSYAFVDASTLLAIILSADSAQSSCDAARIALRNYKYVPDYYRRVSALQLQIVYLQDLRFIRLTAWGMFQVKRDLFLSILALYILYGVLIAQITPLLEPGATHICTHNLNTI